MYLNLVALGVADERVAELGEPTGKVLKIECVLGYGHLEQHLGAVSKLKYRVAVEARVVGHSLGGCRLAVVDDIEGLAQKETAHTAEEVDKTRSARVHNARFF